MKKKILALVLALAMLICAMPAFAYSVRDAYSDFQAEYPGFIDKLVNNGVSEKTILNFLAEIQEDLYWKNRIRPITESNFKDELISSVRTIIFDSQFSGLSSALLDAYPSAVSAALKGEIHSDFMPLYNSVKSMVFDHNMLSSLDNSGDNAAVIIVSIDGQAGAVEASVGGTVSLPSTVSAKTDTGVSMNLDVNWTDVPSTDGVGTYTASGEAVIPADYQLAAGVSTAVTAQVTVVEASQGNSGNNGNSGNSGNGGYSGDNGNYTADENSGTVNHIYKFSDVNENTEVGRAVYALSDIGIINGYADGTFKADNPIRRDEFAKIIVLAMDILDINAVSSFPDVPNTPDNWAYNYIASAEKAALINGVGDGTFSPDRNIRRDEVMVIVYRALDNKKVFKDKTIKIGTFGDDANIADWANESIYLLAQNNIVSGNTFEYQGAQVTNIDPLSNATRGQCVVMIYNALKLMGKIK